MNQKLFFFFHLVVVLCMASTNNLFAQRPPRVSSNPELNKQVNLVTQQPVKGRLDVDTRTLKEGKNVVCQNPKTGKLLVAVVKKGQIVSWEVETTAQNGKATARTAAATTFKATATQQYKLNPKAKTQTASNATANDIPKANARGIKANNCTTITCEECFKFSSDCEQCKKCPSLGVKDPPILVSEGNGVIIDDDIEQQYAITNWSDNYTIISTYSYSYTPYVTIISPQMFNSMGW
jgi:hypothetical protein